MTKYGMAIDKPASSSTSEMSSNSETVVAISSGGSKTTNLPNLPITSHKLNGNNYLQWSQLVLMFVSGKGRDDYLTGAAVEPLKEASNYKTWKTENNMVMSWLINSMNNEISENFLLYSSAQQIWEVAKETYGSKENTSELFSVESILHDLKQGETTVTQYFSTLTRYWLQLNMFEEYDWNCAKDGVKYRKIVEQKRVFKFFLGLNQELDEVRGRILSIKPLPSIREVFSEVRREESRRKVMLEPQTVR